MPFNALGKKKKSVHILADYREIKELILNNHVSKQWPSLQKSTGSWTFNNNFKYSQIGFRVFIVVQRLYGVGGSKWQLYKEQSSCCQFGIVMQYLAYITPEDDYLSVMSIKDR